MRCGVWFFEATMRRGAWSECWGARCQSKCAALQRRCKNDFYACTRCVAERGYACV